MKTVALVLPDLEASKDAFCETAARHRCGFVQLELSWHITPRYAAGEAAAAVPPLKRNVAGLEARWKTKT
jgi:hypothetical protein